YLVGFAARSERARKAGTYLAWLGIVLQSVIFIMRGIQAGHFPLVSMYEFLSAFAWMVVLAYLIFARRYTGPEGGIQAAGVMALLLTVGLLGYAHSLPSHMKQIEALMPVLRSNWLAIHISTAVIGYGAAGLGSALACLYFIRRAAGAEKGWLSERLPSASALDGAVYKCVRFAFPFLTLLNVTGAVWAYYAWGRYWGWDPKETWSLITWLVYLFYLHARLRASWRPPRLNAIILVGLATIMFTFLGVNQLAAFSESLHSYAGGG
ncbi:MAG: c-type cytochrome biogenesis protein CcsB, partial [Armatimonadetes bacterium]|nr:c-type cytochrome biogenesis protein CcsB [Armatimonadota bacterium]NIM23439.1 c-type cytochrome biogenesis protein CcsB [Armatimonadota bacterium]NIM67304.1 c-type cytochrome biogenesis protein CcsB [Armatimonadota bacterium]NIM75802.1 c-type cytochrome biogenesis protein CcsB [Armatimonadota bacterium]NIN05490.1 c-type cytochrome biogenesis protein CcsB [Armatimonadota bacterium]